MNRRDSPEPAVSKSGIPGRSRPFPAAGSDRRRMCNSSEALPERTEAADTDFAVDSTAAAVDAAAETADFAAAAVDERLDSEAAVETDSGLAVLPVQALQPRNRYRTSIPTSAGRVRCCTSPDFQYSQPLMSFSKRPPPSSKAAPIAPRERHI